MRLVFGSRLAAFPASTGTLAMQLAERRRSQDDDALRPKGRSLARRIVILFRTLVGAGPGAAGVAAWQSPTDLELHRVRPCRALSG